MQLGFSAALIASLLVPAARADVLKVSPAGPLDFHEIQDAVDAAADGDVILVAPGEYDSFVVMDKALDIEADGAPCTVTGLVGISSLAAGKTVVVRGLDGLAKFGAALSEGLRIENCAGQVRVEDGKFIGTTENGTTPPFPGATIVASTAVSLHGCRVVGGKNLNTSTIKAGDGLQVSGGSNVALWNSNCGGEWNYAPDGTPARGAVIDGGTLFASDTDFAGGAQNALTPQCEPGADGLVLLGGAHAELLADTFLGGTGSPPRHPQCIDGGPSGQPLVADAASGSSYEIVPGPAREFTASSPVREGQTLSFTFHGLPGEDATLLYSFSAQELWVGGLHETFLLGFPFVTVPLGTTDALGDLEFSTVVPELGAGVTGVTLFCQGFFHGPGAAKALGPGATVLLLDAAF